MELWGLPAGFCQISKVNMWRDAHPNLFTYISGSSGGDKEALGYARQLGAEVHKAKREASKVLAIIEDIFTFCCIYFDTYFAKRST